MRPDAQVRAADLAWIGLAFLAYVFVGFGLRDPWPADEPRFASIALDMVRTGQWLIPHAGGDLYQDKPPLHFWMIGLSYMLTGSTRAAFLLPSMLASLGTLLLVYDLGRRLHGREAGLAAALTLACCVQFVQVTRGAQIDATLVFFVTLAVWALSRHLLLGPHLGLALLGGVAAGLGVIDKAVGFLALMLLPIAWLLQRRGDAIAAGALRPAAVSTVLAGFLGVILAWLLPMLWYVHQVGTPELAAYRDELLFQQTVQRYTSAWHHRAPVYHYLVEVIPALWLPLSALIFWLWRPWRDDWRERRAATWLPLGFSLLVVVFFSFSTGKRGVYILPALPALAMAAAPHLPALFKRSGVGRLSLVLGALLLLPAWVLALGSTAGAARIAALLDDAPTLRLWPVWAFAGAGSLAWTVAARARPLLAWPAVLACLTTAWGLGIAPQLNAERSASGFVAQMLERAPRDRELGMLSYKEQFLLYLDREVVNFGHARWREGMAEPHDAAAWLAQDPKRLLLVPDPLLKPCFAANARRLAGRSSGDDWWLVEGAPDADCVRQGDPGRAIRYQGPRAPR
ncbi:MAG: phospholipid carrier-dependent glycosyltransferase [Gammaproteobacteria bacterium]|nr:phospholipid carrier-dependent glycosyltransferase [Gammaproteobacteria bacterium]